MNESRPEGIDRICFDEVEAFPPFDQIDHGQLFALSLSNSTTSFTHGLHRFPAKFIPQVPAWALDNFGTRATTTLDPFMGSGTTLVEGLLRGGTTVGIDIDPLARFIARAKVSNADDERIAELGRVIDAKWRAPAERLRTPMPDIKNFGHWFQPEQWGWVQSLHDTIGTLDCTDEERVFLLAVFSSTLRWVSNADDQSQKTYVSGTLPKTPPPVTEVFWRFFTRAVNGLSELNRKRHSEALVSIPSSSDATSLGLQPETIDLAITSPPYLDSVDYAYNMMMEYFWLGPHIGVPDRQAFNRIRREPVGAKNPAERIGLPDALEGIVRLDMMPPARRVAATTYFALMERHFAEMAHCLKEGARYVLVVGNSQTLRGVVPLHDAFVALAAAAGLQMERAFGYRIRRHYMKFPRNGRGGIILIDWILVFRKGWTGPIRDSLPSPWVTLAPDAVAH